MIPRYFLRCFCLQKRANLKDISKEDFYLNKGRSKLNNDMDVVSIIRLLHNVDIMTSILFTEFEQILLNFQRQVVLDSSSNESDQDKAKAKRTQRAILSHQICKERSRFKGQMIEQMQSWLEQELKPTEQRLLTGIMTNHVSRVD